MDKGAEGGLPLSVPQQRRILGRSKTYSKTKTTKEEGVVMEVFPLRSVEDKLADALFELDQLRGICALFYNANYDRDNRLQSDALREYEDYVSGTK
jgi:hypothetical protein